MIPSRDGAFPVEVSIRDTYPAKVSPFATKADPEVGPPSMSAGRSPKRAKLAISQARHQCRRQSWPSRIAGSPGERRVDCRGARVDLVPTILRRYRNDEVSLTAEPGVRGDRVYPHRIIAHGD